MRRGALTLAAAFALAAGIWIGKPGWGGEALRSVAPTWRLALVKAEYAAVQARAARLMARDPAVAAVRDDTLRGLRDEADRLRAQGASERAALVLSRAIRVKWWILGALAGVWAALGARSAAGRIALRMLGRAGAGIALLCLGLGLMIGAIAAVDAGIIPVLLYLAGGLASMGVGAGLLSDMRAWWARVAPEWYAAVHKVPREVVLPKGDGGGTVPPEMVARARRVLAGGGIIIPDPVFRAMAAHARTEAPREACGVVSGGPVVGMPGFVALGYHPLLNTAGDRDSFAMDPQHLGAVIEGIEARGLAVVGTFHSHPRGEPVPSELDTSLAMAHWPQLLHLIMSLSDPRWRRLRAYRVQNGQAVPAPLAVVPWPEGTGRG